MGTMTASPMIRMASRTDAQAVRYIYSPSVLKTATSFEVDLPPVEEFEKRIEEIQKQFPWLVCELNGVVVGYAYASPHRTRSAYAWSVESTVYVDESCRRQGIAKILYEKLFQILKQQGVVNVLAGITIPNMESIYFHESMGFQKIAQFKDIGFKMGKWWDVGWWQLQLQRPDKPQALSIYSV